MDVLVLGICNIKILQRCDLRMLYVYIPSQKFNMIRILVFRDITKIWKKSTILTKSKTYICIIIMPKIYYQKLFEKLIIHGRKRKKPWFLQW